MFHINVQYATDKSLAPEASLIRKWAKKALAEKILRTAQAKPLITKSAEMTIRIVDKKESAKLNANYRHKNKPTNVLSFPFDLPKEAFKNSPLLGDIIICAEVVNQEAQEQHKSPHAHWAHMVIHGVFHLLGFDHQTKRDAKVMESLEIKIMQTLGFANPYEEINE